MKRSVINLAVVLLSMLAAMACGSGRLPTATLTPSALATADWASIEHEARDTTVYFAMWAGDEARNRFYQGPVTRLLADRFGVTLRIVPLGDTADLVNRLLNERRAGRTAGSVDMVWINGENFRTARQGDLLWGPFADALPNIRHFPPAARERDFGTRVEGYEAPWQHGHFVFAYDTRRVAAPPDSMDALLTWIEEHPGRFTYPAPPDFTGSAFIRHVLFHGGGESPTAFADGFDEALYARAAGRALQRLRDLRPFLWRRGETYPATPADLDRLFVNGEIDMSMNYGPTFASEKIERGQFPESVRTFVLRDGTIFNYSFLAMPFNAPNPAGALVVINHLLSPEHAIDRARALGGVFPLDRNGLSATEREAVDALPRGPATLPLDVLEAHRIPEADAQYLTRFEADWQQEVLQR